MIYYDDNKYKVWIDEASVASIEHQYGIQCLFGGAYSSYVLGIDNVVSDFDFYLVYEHNPHRKEKYRYLDEEANIEFVLLDYEFLKSNMGLYMSGLHEFPSIHCRKEEIWDQRPNMFREDFACGVLFEILYSDYIWDSGYLRKHGEEILGMLPMVIVMDYYYVRAYGNLHQFLREEKVDVNRYLRSFLWISCMEWLMENGTVPCMDISEMMKLYCPMQYRPCLKNMLQQKKLLEIEGNPSRFHLMDAEMQELPARDKVCRMRYEKPQIMVSRHNGLNQWMGNRLSDIRLFMTACSTEEKVKQGTGFAFQGYSER